MKIDRAKQIVAKWREIEDADPDISTEMLIQLTQEAFNFSDCGPVTTALGIVHDLEADEEEAKSC